MAHDGKGVDAIKNAAIGFQLSNHAYQNPTLIGWLVGIAVDAITVNNIEHIMAVERTDPAVIAAAEEALADWKSHPMTASLSGEVVMGVTEIEIVRHLKTTSWSQFVGDDSDMPSAFKNAAKSPAAWNDFVDANGLVLIRFYKDIIAASAEPYPTSYKEMDAIDKGMDNKGDNYTLAHIMCPVLSSAVDKQAQIEARVDLARASAALFTYKAAHGDYPGGLAQAMTEAPIDPFNLQPIGYRPDGGGFILYSVGPNGNYAGGASTSFDVVLRVGADGSVAWK